MATVTGYTAERMDQISNETVVDGNVVGNDLVLVTRGGTEINAGSVRGPVGPNGPSMTIVESVADLPVYTAGSGHNDEVAFVNETNDFHIWSDTTRRWSTIAMTVPASVGNPILLASDGGSAIFSHITPGTPAALEITPAGGLILRAVTDIRLGTKNGGQPLILPAGGGVKVVGRLAIDDTYLKQVATSLRIEDVNGAARAIIAGALTSEGSLTVNGTSTFNGAVSVPSLSSSGSITGKAIVGTSLNVGTGGISAGGLSVGAGGLAAGRLDVSTIAAGSISATGGIGADGMTATGRMQADNFLAASGRFFAAGGQMRFLTSGVEAGQFQLTNHYDTPNTMFRIGATDGRPACWLLMSSQFGMMFMATDPQNYDWVGNGRVPLWAGDYIVAPRSGVTRLGANLPAGALARVNQLVPKVFTEDEVSLPSLDLPNLKLAMPDAVLGNDEVSGYSVPAVIAYLVAAVNELSAKVAALEAVN